MSSAAVVAQDALLEGVWNIVPTPFTDDGSLDVPSLATLTDFVIDRGVDGMTILGVLGEAAKLTDAERLTVIEAVVAPGGRTGAHLCRRERARPRRAPSATHVRHRSAAPTR